MTLEYGTPQYAYGLASYISQPSGGLHYNIHIECDTANTAAQSFLATSDVEIGRICLRLNRCAPNLNPITVEVREDLGKPDYLCHYTIPNSEIPQGPNGGLHWKQVRFPIVSGTTYYLCVGSPDAGKNPHCFIYTTSDLYTNGSRWENQIRADGDFVFELEYINNYPDINYGTPKHGTPHFDPSP